MDDAVCLGRAVRGAQVRDARAAGRVAENILEVLRQPVTISGHTLVVTTSMGITLAPGNLGV